MTDREDLNEIALSLLEMRQDLATAKRENERLKELVDTLKKRLKKAREK